MYILGCTNRAIMSGVSNLPHHYSRTQPCSFWAECWIHIPKLPLNSKGVSHIVSGTTTQQSCSRIETDGTSVLPGMTINGETVNIFLNQISQSASACIGGFSGFYGHSTGQCAVG